VLVITWFLYEERDVLSNEIENCKTHKQGRSEVKIIRFRTSTPRQANTRLKMNIVYNFEKIKQLIGSSEDCTGSSVS
jgi:hypothetical protein